MTDEVVTKEEPTTAGAPAAGESGTTPRTVAGAEPKSPKPAAEGKAPEEQTTNTPPPAAGSDWREKMAEHAAAGDKKVYKRELDRLSRFSSPEAIYGSWRDLESKFSEGGLTKVPGKDAKPEDIAAFHKALGVPEKPEEYLKDLDLGEGRVLGEQDKPIAESFVNAMHKTGMTKEQAGAAMNWFFENQEQFAGAQEEHDEKVFAETMKVMKEEFGASAKRQITASHALFRDAPGGTDLKNPNSVMAQFFAARMPNGNLVGNDPEMVKLLVNWNRQLNPAESVVDTTSGGSGMNIDQELASIRKVMRENRPAYNNDPKMQARYRELIGAQLNEQRRSRAA